MEKREGGILRSKHFFRESFASCSTLHMERTALHHFICSLLRCSPGRTPPPPPKKIWVSIKCWQLPKIRVWSASVEVNTELVAEAKQLPFLPNSIHLHQAGFPFLQADVSFSRCLPKPSPCEGGYSVLPLLSCMVIAWLQSKPLTHAHCDRRPNEEKP